MTYFTGFTIFTFYHHLLVGIYHHLLVGDYHHLLVSTYHHLLVGIYHHLLVGDYHHLLVGKGVASKSVALLEFCINPEAGFSRQRNALSSFYS